MTTTIPAKYRGTVYAVYGILGVVLGAVQVGYGAVDVGTPTWLKVALAVFTFLGGAIGYTALAHTTPDTGTAAVQPVSEIAAVQDDAVPTLTK